MALLVFALTEFRLPIWAGALAGACLAGCFFFAVFTNRKLQSQVQASAKLLEEARESSRVKSDFLANMSHEIRTPMNGILGLAELVLGTELTPIQRDFVGSINESANSLLSIINEILDCSRIEAGKMQLDRAQFDLHRLVTEAVRMFAYQAHEKNLELLYFISSDVPFQVEGDATRLRQILVNLLGNALKFTRKGEVELRCELILSEPDQVQLRFSIRDTGIGIPKAKQKEIFAAFTQADSSISREFGGTGLGLTISAQIARLMGGEIRVESQPGAGSTFHCSTWLHSVLPDSGWDAARAETRAVLDGKRLLVVDDNETNLQNIEKTLGDGDAVVTKASSAHAAVRAIAEAQRDHNPFDAVVIDSDMPGVDGFTLVRDLLGRNSAGRKPAVMMLTSKNLNEHVEKCRELGITFLLKPVSTERLMQVVADLVAARKPAAADSREATPGSRQRGPSPQILLAEDNIVNQKIVVEMLRKANCQVHAVANGAEAIASWKHKNYDLILMDMQMPRMDGVEAASKIREAERSGRTRIPILALTANARDEDRQRCLDAGMDDYLSKPFKSEQLMDKVHQLVGVPRAA